MELTNRITRVLYLDGTGVLLADVAGRIHLLDTDLRLLRSSPVIDGGLPIHGLAADHRWVVGRDRGGTVLRWSLPELDLLDRLDKPIVLDADGLWALAGHLDWVFLREAPTTSAQALTSLANGTPIQILPETASGNGFTWLRVRTTDGVLGWMVSTAIEG